MCGRHLQNIRAEQQCRVRGREKRKQKIGGQDLESLYMCKWNLQKIKEQRASILVWIKQD
jgi:hypothetical protein